MNSAFDLGTLAPPPDFRYVGLHPDPGNSIRILLAAVGAGAACGLLFGHGFARAALSTVAVASTTLALARPRRARRSPGARAGNMAIVPWGVLVESEDSSRVLRWAAVERVHLHLIFGRDQGTPTSSYSFVTVETEHESFSGRAFGAVALERLVVHLEAYAREAAHRVALDLEGVRPGEGPIEPDFEPLLLSARAFVESAPASQALDLPPAGYRKTSTRAGSFRSIEVLRNILRDRTDHTIDPRAFAAVVAAELRATELADDLVALVQSPHPFIAAVARVAARKLGVATSRAGALDEVAPFLLGRDIDALRAWGAA